MDARRKGREIDPLVQKKPRPANQHPLPDMGHGNTTSRQRAKCFHIGYGKPTLRGDTDRCLTQRVL
jgi:hypothetical protein